MSFMLCYYACHFKRVPNWIFLSVCINLVPALISIKRVMLTNCCTILHSAEGTTCFLNHQISKHTTNLLSQLKFGVSAMVSLALGLNNRVLDFCHVRLQVDSVAEWGVIQSDLSIQMWLYYVTTHHLWMKVDCMFVACLPTEISSMCCRSLWSIHCFILTRHHSWY